MASVDDEDDNCVKCGEGISAQRGGCTALGHTYHVDCFLCSRCDKRLAGTSFYAVDEKPLCDNCHLESLDKCHKCNKTITERILRANGKPYHPLCFACVACGRSLDGVPFTVDGENNTYCVPCYHEKHAPRCAACSQPIVPEEGQTGATRVVSMEKSFHIDCYKCEDCSTQLNSKIEGKGCYPLDDHLLCKSCNYNRLQKMNA